MTKEETLKLKTDVKDELNKLLILLKDVGELEERDSEDWDNPKKYKDSYDYEDEEIDFDDNLLYLRGVKNYLKRAVKAASSYEVVYNEQKYYDSTCY